VTQPTKNCLESNSRKRKSTCENEKANAVR